jgi:hypothetical protein
MVLSGDLVVRIAACVVVMKESKFILIRPVYGILMYHVTKSLNFVIIKLKMFSTTARMAKLVRRHTSNVAILSSTLSASMFIFLL